MKKIFIISCMLFLAHITFGQQIRSRDVELDDIMNLLRASGYELFSSDVSEMLNARYNLHFIKKEFEAGEEVDSSYLIPFPIGNKRLLTDFPESQRQGFFDRGGQLIDADTQTVALLETINLGFYPSGNDSTKFMQIHVPEFVTIPRIRFNLRALPHSDRFFYQVRPFKIEAFKENEFIPLILLGSGWWDERFNVHRFCTEIEFNPDMSSESLKLMPHYFIVGVRFDRQN
jgi:hypothetical protein